MALIWHRQHDGIRYEVRSHGKTLRLFANGVQHSEYHPDRLVTGSVWDLLWLPALFDQPQRYRRVLVLGLGGGSILPPLQRLLKPDVIVAVEKDPLHLEVARDQFRVAAPGTKLVGADACDFVRNYDGPPFDLIIEDLFAPSDSSVSRAVAATARWVGELKRLLNQEGTLIMNFGDWAEFKQSWAASANAMRGWKRRYRFATPDCHNAVIAFRRDEAGSDVLRANLRAHPLLSTELMAGRLDYTVRHVSQLD